MFRIYTVDAPNAREVIAQSLVAEGIDSFTLTHTEGYYKGEREDSIVVDIEEPEETPEGFDYNAGLLNAVEMMRRALAKDCILVSDIQSFPTYVRRVASSKEAVLIGDGS